MGYVALVFVLISFSLIFLNEQYYILIKKKEKQYNFLNILIISNCNKIWSLSKVPSHVADRSKPTWGMLVSRQAHPQTTPIHPHRPFFFPPLNTWNETTASAIHEKFL